MRGCLPGVPSSFPFDFLLCCSDSFIFSYPILVPTVNHIFGHRYGMKVYAMLIQNLDNIKFFFPCLLLLK